MNKRFFAVLAVIALLLSGCQLAQPDAGEAAERDRMIGVFITTDHLELIDTEAFFEENMGSIAAGEALTVDEIYSLKLYAQMTQERTERSDGTAITTQTFRFEEVDGMVLAAFWASWKDASGNEVEGYWSSETGEGLSDVHVHYNTADTGNSVQIDASIYVTGNATNYCFYLNPIYQSADGQVYLVPGTGASFDTALAGQLDLTLADEVEHTENGVKTTNATDIHVTIDFVKIAEEVVVIQMDENNREVCRDSYTPGKLPEEITPEKDAAYILMEEHSGDTINRWICQPDSDRVEVFYSLENGICVKDSAAVKWQEFK